MIYNGFMKNNDSVIQNGFTLVELIVVLASAVIITGVLFVAVDPAALLAKERDAQRLQALDELNLAIQQAMAEGQIVLADTSECKTCNSFSGSVKVDGSGWVKFTVPENKQGLVKFLGVLPVDPINMGSQVYSFKADAKEQVYEISVPLESKDNHSLMQADEGNEPLLYEVGTNLDL